MKQKTQTTCIPERIKLSQKILRTKTIKYCNHESEDQQSCLSFFNLFSKLSFLGIQKSSNLIATWTKLSIKSKRPEYAFTENRTKFNFSATVTQFISMSSMHCLISRQTSTVPALHEGTLLDVNRIYSISTMAKWSSTMGSGRGWQF